MFTARAFLNSSDQSKYGDLRSQLIGNAERLRNEFIDIAIDKYEGFGLRTKALYFLSHYPEFLLLQSPDAVRSLVENFDSEFPPERLAAIAVSGTCDTDRIFLHSYCVALAKVSPQDVAGTIGGKCIEALRGSNLETILKRTLTAIRKRRGS